MRYLSLNIFPSAYSPRHIPPTFHPPPKINYNITPKSQNICTSFYQWIKIVYWNGTILPITVVRALVARVRFPDPASHAGWVCCSLTSLLQGFKVCPSSCFSYLLKNQHLQNSNSIIWWNPRARGLFVEKLFSVTLVKQSRFIYLFIFIFIDPNWTRPLANTKEHLKESFLDSNF